MNIFSFLNRVSNSQILRHAAVTLIALAWSSLALCAPIHDASKAGDLAKVEALLMDNP